MPEPGSGHKKPPLPPLEELAEGTTTLIEAGLGLGTQPRREMEKTLKEAGTLRDWYPEKHSREQDMSLNTHLGARGVMSTGRRPTENGNLGTFSTLGKWGWGFGILGKWG